MAEQEVEAVLVDMNAALDYVLVRHPFYSAANAIVEAHEDGKITAYVAAFTIPTIFYIVEREIKRQYTHQQAAREALAGVQACLDAFLVCPVDRAMIEEAVAMPNPDFEDNLQIACARAAGIKIIVTRDEGMSSPNIEVLSPTELLQRLAKK